MGSSTSWNPQGLFRSVMGLLHFLPLFLLRKIITSKKMQIETDDWKEGRGGDYASGQCAVYSVFIANV